MKTKNKTEEVKENTVVLEDTATSGSTKEFNVAHFSGTFNNVELNLLRDKVNEVIDVLNKK